MNLKTKPTLLFLGTSFLFVLSFGIWKSIETEKSRKRIMMLETELMVSGYRWIENVELYSKIYFNYFTNKVSIQEEIGGKTSVLVYRYSKSTCGSCLMEDLQEIELFLQEIGKEKILLLPAYPDTREGRIELASVLAKFNYVNIPVESFLIPSQDGDFMQRYFAVIDEEGNLTMVFFPRSGDPNLTRIYFSAVREEIDKSNFIR